MRARLVKRLFDIVVSSLSLLFTVPFYLVVAAAIKLESRGPVFYKQIRVGLKGKLFKIVKFRTMVDGAESGGALSVKGDARITGVGRWLRRFKIDEMPTLFNVLKGEMSIVGPRPEVPKYVRLYTDEQREVLSVKPGITDLGTLRFNNENELVDETDNYEQFYIQEILPEKLKLNLEYVDNMGLWVDIKIILATVRVIVRHANG